MEDRLSNKPAYRKAFIYKSLFTETYGSKIERRTDIYKKKKEMREYTHM